MNNRYSGATRLAGIWVLLLVLVATGARAGPPQFLERHPGCLVTGTGTVPIELEHAITTEQRRYGLMERTELPRNQGMVFLYPSERSPTAGFWMYRTRIPLDIAWLDEDGVILALDTMTPCTTQSPRDCPSWAPGVSHRHVLEMNAGFFRKNHVGVGDRLVVNLNNKNTCPGVD